MFRTLSLFKSHFGSTLELLNTCLLNLKVNSVLELINYCIGISMQRSQTRINHRNFDNVLENIIEENNTEPEIIQEYLGKPEYIGKQEHRGNQEYVEKQNDTNEDGSGNLEHKLDIISLSNGWNDKNERIIISVGENAASYKWMHERSASFYKNINKVISIIMIIFSTGLSAETIIPISDENLSINIVRRVFTYVITFLSILQNFLKYEQLSEQHLASAMSFAQLYHEIQQQMCMYRRDRKNATKYVSETLKQYDSLIVNGPDIVNSVVASFKETFKNSDISLPDIADKIQKIEIISEPKSDQQTGNNMYNTKTANIIVNTDTRRYGRYGICNLQQIHNAFQIQGDISDNDIQHADETQLRDLRKKFLKEKSSYEYERFLQHN